MEEVFKNEENLIKEPDKQLPIKAPIKPKRKRIWELDFLRGICVLLMIFDHTMYDLQGFKWGWVSSGTVQFASYYFYDSTIRTIFWPIIVSLFFILSGISATFSKSNLYRALKILIFAYAVSFFASFVGIVINFGVLHAFGFSILIYSLLNFIDKTIWSKLAFGIIFVVLGALIETGYSEFFRMPPSMQWLNNIIGMPAARFRGHDYFALFPWTGVFLLGSVIGRLFYKDRKSLLGKIETKFTKPVEFAGRHTLIIYPAHQLVVFGLFYLISIISGHPLSF